MAMKKEKRSTDKVLQKALDRFTQSWTYASTHYHQRWQENWQLFNNQRVKRMHDGVVKTFVPMTNSLVNTLVASLYNNRPRFTFIPDSPSGEEAQNTDVLNEMIMDFWQKGGWDRVFTANGTETIITGNGPVMFSWSDDRICAEAIPVRDFIVDPSATSPENWRWAGRRYLTDCKALKEETTIDPETGEVVPRYKDVDKAKRSAKGSGDLTDKQLKDSLLGSTIEGEDQVEIIEIWSKDRVVTIAGRSVVIEDIENPYKTKQRLNWQATLLEFQIQAMQEGIPEEQLPKFEYEEKDGLIPFALARDYIDNSLIYGSSDVDLIRDQQELLNDLTELNIEAVLYTVFPERTIDPKFMDQIDDLNPAPGKVYAASAGSIIWNNPPAIPHHVFDERANIKSEIRETTAVDQIVKGVTSATSQTATEIKAQLGQSSQRIEMKAKNLENDFFFQVANICLKLIRLYVTETTWVRTMGQTGVDFVQYDPKAFLGDYTPMVQLDITRELEKARDQQAAIEAYQMLIADPKNNLDEVKKIMYPKILPDLNQDQIDLMITPATPPAMSVPEAEPPTLDAGGGVLPSEQLPPDEPMGDVYAA